MKTDMSVSSNQFVPPRALRAPEGLNPGGPAVAGPGQSQSQQVTEQQASTDPNRPTQNNPGSNEDLLQGLWEPQEAKSSGEQVQMQMPAPVSQAPVDPKVQLQQHLDSVGLGAFTMTEAEKQEFMTDPAAAMEKMNQRVQTSYIKAMSNINTLVDQKLENFKKETGADTRNTFAAEQFQTRLKTELPFVNDPLVKPVAIQVARNLLQRGKTEEQAIAGVKAFFSKVNESTSEFTTANTNLNGNFKSRHNDNTDWLNVLREK